MSEKLSLLALFSTWLFSQAIFSNYQDNKKLLALTEKKIKNEIAEFAKLDENDSKRQRLGWHFDSFTSATNTWLNSFEKTQTFETETFKKEWAWNMEQYKKNFLKQLDLVNCQLGKECNNARKEIKNRVDQYYKLAQKIAGYFPKKEIPMPTIKNEKEILKYWEEIKAKENLLKRENYPEIPFEKMEEEKSLIQKLYQLINTYQKRAKAREDLLTKKMKIMLDYYIPSEGCKGFLEVNFEALLRATNKAETEKKKERFLKKFSSMLCQGISKKNIDPIKKILEKGYAFALDRLRINKEAFELKLYLGLREMQHQWHLERKQQSAQ